MAREIDLGNIMTRPMDFPTGKGHVVHGHVHNFDHCTLIQRGGVRIEVLQLIAAEETDPITGMMTKPAEYKVLRSVDRYATDTVNLIRIKAECIHRLTALTDDAKACCIYAHRFPQLLAANEGKHAEYDALMARLRVMSDELFGDIVQEADGWEAAYV